MKTNTTPPDTPTPLTDAEHQRLFDAPLINGERFDQMAEFAKRLERRNARLVGLLSAMLNVAENCDETGYADGVGFVDIDKLHAEVRACIDAATQSAKGGEGEE